MNTSGNTANCQNKYKLINDTWNKDDFIKSSLHGTSDLCFLFVVLLFASYWLGSAKKRGRSCVVIVCVPLFYYLQ